VSEIRRLLLPCVITLKLDLTTINWLENEGQENEGQKNLQANFSATISCHSLRLLP